MTWAFAAARSLGARKPAAFALCAGGASLVSMAFGSGSAILKLCLFTAVENAASPIFLTHACALKYFLSLRPLTRELVHQRVSRRLKIWRLALLVSYR